ncbi:MAG: NUDIX domain-containing protein [Defluviitaleaceae bacterium]|nr:NUDIX domain-containing protein [Defluviitaleaceae bacterium]
MSKHFQLLCAVHLILADGENILLSRRFNTGYEDGNFSLVAGHLNGGETAKGAMIREAREEAGIIICPNDLDIVLVMHRRVPETGQERIDYFLRSETWQGEIMNNEPDKCDLLEWHDANLLPKNIVQYVARAISRHLNGVVFDSFGFGGDL